MMSVCTRMQAHAGLYLWSRGQLGCQSYLLPCLLSVPPPRCISSGITDHATPPAFHGSTGPQVHGSMGSDPHICPWSPFPTDLSPNSFFFLLLNKASMSYVCECLHAHVCTESVPGALTDQRECQFSGTELQAVVNYRVGSGNKPRSKCSEPLSRLSSPTSFSSAGETAFFCSPGWPQNHGDPLASTSCVLELQM